MKILFVLVLMGLAVLYIGHVKSVCLLTKPNPPCLEYLSEDESMEILNYILTKYEELEMKVVGDPLSVVGKRITIDGVEETQISFRYKDNTPHDVFQTCAFVVISQPNQCDALTTTCNSFSTRTPRPILSRKPLQICNDVAQVVEASEIEGTETTTIVNKESNEQPINTYVNITRSEPVL